MTIPSLKFHSVIPLGGGLAWSLGGYDFGTGFHRQGCEKIDLASSTVIATDTIPYGFGHSPAFYLDGCAVVPGGMGVVGSTFRALQEIQWLDLASGVENWQTPVWPFGGYDLSGCEVSASRAIYCGGHAWQPAANEGWARWEAGIIEMTGGVMSHTPIEGVVPRVYATAHALSADEAIFIGGWSYADTNLARRNLSTIEIIGTSGARLFPADLDAARRYHSSRKVGDKIYVIGGTAHPQSGRPPAIGSIEEIDLTAGAVRTLASGLIYPRYHAHTASAVINGRDYLVVVGGQSDAGQAVTAVELYDIAAETSQVIGTTRPAVDHDRISVVDGNTLYVVGGEDPVTGNAYSDVVAVPVAGAVLARL